MSDQSGGNGGNGDRATVALVNSKIDTVLAKVEGQRDTTRAQFETIKSRLDGLSSMMGRLDTLEQKQTALEAQVSQLQRGHTYRTTYLPQLLIGVATLAVAIIAVVIASG